MSELGGPEIQGCTLRAYPEDSGIVAPERCFSRRQTQTLYSPAEFQRLGHLLRPINPPRRCPSLRSNSGFATVSCMLKVSICSKDSMNLVPLWYLGQETTVGQWCKVPFHFSLDGPGLLKLLDFTFTGLDTARSLMLPASPDTPDSVLRPVSLEELSRAPASFPRAAPPPLSLRRSAHSRSSTLQRPGTATDDFYLDLDGAGGGVLRRSSGRHSARRPVDEEW